MIHMKHFLATLSFALLSTVVVQAAHAEDYLSINAGE